MIVDGLIVLFLFYVRIEGTSSCGYTRAPCVTMLCRTPAFGLYGRESDNCITNRAAQGPEYKLSYDARTI